MARRKVGSVKVTRRVTVTQKRTIRQSVTPTYVEVQQPVTITTTSKPTQITTSTSYKRPTVLPQGKYSSQVEDVYTELSKQKKSTEEEKLALYDVFISHASEDKAGFVDELVEELQNAGVSVWYDALEMQWGKSLREQIDRGIKRSKYAIVVLSKNFLAKKWTKRELDGILVKEEVTGVEPLPIWHNISFEEVYEFSPTLTGLYALSTDSVSIKDICKALLLILEKEQVSS